MSPTRFLRLTSCSFCLATLLLLSSAASAQSVDDDDERSVEELWVTSTRSVRLLRDEAVHIEALPEEEIEENATVQPGNLTALLSELPGVRIQSAAAGLGGAGLSLRGMPSRHTRVLVDGLPLFGTEANDFALLQTPPLDLGRVEVIKGSASALYGSGALGGVLNLISQKPGAESVALANASSQGGEDLVGFLSAETPALLAGTVLMSAHHQTRRDLDRDGWAEVAGYRRVTVRPRLWWNEGGSASLFLTAGAVREERLAGTMPAGRLPDGSPFEVSTQTRRNDAGAVALWDVDGGTHLALRAAVTSTGTDLQFGTQQSRTSQGGVWSEATWAGNRSGHDWVLGLAYQRNTFSLAGRPDLTYHRPSTATFAQDEYSPLETLTLAASLRIDRYRDYANPVSHRLSVLWQQPQSSWSLRAALASGFASPDYQLEGIEATTPNALIAPLGLRMETGRTASLDLRWVDEGWDINLSAFTASIRNTLEVVPEVMGSLRLQNSGGTWRSPGAEALVGYVQGPLHLLGSWTFLSATQRDEQGQSQSVSRLPRHSAELAAILEAAGRGRVGLEFSYVGRQRLDADPYRSEGPAYWLVGALAERRIGPVAVYLNLVNVLDVYQARYSPILRPLPGRGGTPVVEAWAPLQGRTLNFGIRADL